MKPKVFVGSSREGVHIADAIHANLTYDAECTVWKDGVFQLSSNTLSDLFRVLRESDFGIFVFSPDDVSIMRSATSITVRDNVLFELGLFLGRLGPERCFFLIPDNAADLRLPTDLAGITPGRYEAARSDNNWMAALNPACMQIRMAMSRTKPFQDANSVNMATGTPVAQANGSDSSTVESDTRVWLEPHKNSFLIKGATKPHKERIKIWASWNKTLCAWVLPASKKDEFEAAFGDIL